MLVFTCMNKVEVKVKKTKKMFEIFQTDENAKRARIVKTFSSEHLEGRAYNPKPSRGRYKISE